MNERPARSGLEPLARVEPLARTSRPQIVRSAVRLNIRGRSVRLRGLRLPPKGIWRWLAILGPGLIASSAGNDAGGIATYSSTGAQYGYELIWVMLLITVSLSVVQEMCARLGAVTGRGLLDLIRERFGVNWAVFAVGVILIANGGLIVSEFVGIGAATELLGVSKLFTVPTAAALIFYLVVFGNYWRVEKIFLLMTLVFFAYPVAAFMAHPHWGEVARGAFVPKLHRDPNYIFLLVGLIGTTITPYMQLFQQSSVVERGGDRVRYGPERVDVYSGAIFSNLMSIFIIIATAATLHAIGKNNINTAADAARALEPVAGHFAGRYLCGRPCGSISLGRGGVTAGNELCGQRSVWFFQRSWPRFPQSAAFLHFIHWPNNFRSRRCAHPEPAGDQTVSVDSGAKWRLAADLPGIHSPAYQ